METYVPSLIKKYQEEVIAKLQTKFGYKSPMQVPKLLKIVINQGLGDAVSDKRLVENAVKSMKSQLISQLNKNGSIRKVLIDRGFNFDHKSISDSVNNRVIFSLTEFENSLLDYYLTIKAENGPRAFGGIKEEIEQILIDLEMEIKK